MNSNCYSNSLCSLLPTSSHSIFLPSLSLRSLFIAANSSLLHCQSISSQEPNNFLRCLTRVECFMVLPPTASCHSLPITSTVRCTKGKKKKDHQAPSFPPSCMYIELILVTLKTTNKI